MVGHWNVRLDHAETRLAAAPSGAACLTLAERSPALLGGDVAHAAFGPASDKFQPKKPDLKTKTP
jgi:hypothetical protein